MIYDREPIEIIDGVPVFEKKDEYVKNYDAIADELISSLQSTGHNPWMSEEHWSRMENETVEICRKYLRDGQRLLDVGCGTGRLLGYFSGVERYGIDISVAMAKMCRNSGIEACMGNVQELPYASESFDMVVCTDVLEHVFDLYKTISEILRELKKGGVAVLRTPQNQDTEGNLDPEYPSNNLHLPT